ncbi:cytochrome c oxidase subunit I [bacterium]|nr:cytochrome c oxidase subunit I [bacterium]
MSTQSASVHPHAPTKPTWLKWLTTTDHKKIGIMYIFTAFFFFMLAGFFALLVRAQLLFPGNTLLTPDQYNQMVTMHASGMIFFAVIPLLVGFGNYAVPLMIGARDMAFPRVNAIAFWMLPFGALMMMSSFFLGGAAAGGWTQYPPLSGGFFSPGRGVDMWILGLHVVGVSSIMGSINFIVTILNMRAPGMRLHKMPLLSWTVLVQSWLQLIATPVLAGVLTMLLFDRNFGTSFFRPEHGGDPLLWQHLFWFYSHPAVYIMILPAFGIVSEILPVFSGKPIFGYLAIAYSSVAIGVLGFVVWAHHMFATGLPVSIRMVFMFLTMLIAVPTGIKIFSWVATLWGGQIRFTVAALYAIAFVAFFLIGGLSGIFLASVPVDVQLTHTYFVVAHIHYVLFAGSMLGIFAAIYFWFPKMFGKMLDEKLGMVHFWLTIIAMNVTFFPMHVLGIMGIPRRYYTYSAHLTEVATINTIESIGSFVLGVAQFILIYNVIVSLKKGKTAGDDPWGANTLEWTVSSPPPDNNFDVIPTIR